MSHRLIFRYVQRFSEAASWLNLLFLMLVGLMPLATGVLQLGIQGEKAHISAIEIYVGLIICLSVVVGILWAYVALIAKLVDPRVAMPFRWITLLRLSVFPPVMCTASLWFGMKFGLWPAVIFVSACAFASGMIHSDPFGKPKAEDTPT